MHLIAFAEQASVRVCVHYRVRQKQGNLKSLRREELEASHFAWQATSSSKDFASGPSAFYRRHEASSIGMLHDATKVT